jgi:hypothetical protein
MYAGVASNTEGVAEGYAGSADWKEADCGPPRLLVEAHREIETDQGAAASREER